jgi:MerR family mercuric resistance operon transcriptional regulator
VRPLTLAQLARAVGMRVDDVQLYESRGLLPRARRLRGRSGLVAFHQEHVERLRFIRRAIEHGFSLDAIAQLLDPTSLATCNDIYRIASRQLQRLRRLKGPGAPSPATLRELMDMCSRTGNRGDCRIYSVLAGKLPLQRAKSADTS